ncbi:60S ribosomal protein L10, partial [Linum perenne]
ALKLIRFCLVFPLAFGKPQGYKDNTSQHAQEALHRAKFKFPGRQKIIVSWKWYVYCFLYLCSILCSIVEVAKNILISVIVMDDCHNAIHTFSYRLNTIVLHMGFTKFNRADHVKLKQENGIMPDGVNSKVSMLKLQLG